MIGGPNDVQLPYLPPTGVKGNPANSVTPMGPTAAPTLGTSGSANSGVIAVNSDGTCSCSQCQNNANSLSLGTAGSASSIAGVSPQMAALLNGSVGNTNGVQGLPTLNNANPTQKAIGPAALTNNPQALQLMEQIKEVASQLLQMISGGGAPANTIGGAGGPVTPSGNNTIGGAGGPVSPRNTGGSTQLAGVNNPQLQRSLDAIAADPEGAILLQEAARRGVTIQMGQTGGANIAGEFHPGENKIIVKDPNNVKTIVHELVHAVTPQDGDSQSEEGIANIIGYRVSNRLTGGQSQSPNDIFNRTLALYPELKFNNNIRNSLSGLGISV